MIGYMKAGLSEEALCDFQVNKHAQLVSGFMEKYGVERYTIVRESFPIFEFTAHYHFFHFPPARLQALPSTNSRIQIQPLQTHNTAATRALLHKIFDPSYAEFADHDFVVRIIFPDLDVFFALKDDPVYKELIAMDHLNFADRKMKTRYAPSSNTPPEQIPPTDQSNNAKFLL
jgi:EthD domain